MLCFAECKKKSSLSFRLNNSNFPEDVLLSNPPTLLLREIINYESKSQNNNLKLLIQREKKNKRESTRLKVSLIIYQQHLKNVRTNLLISSCDFKEINLEEEKINNCNINTSVKIIGQLYFSFFSHYPYLTVQKKILILIINIVLLCISTS